MSHIVYGTIDAKNGSTNDFDAMNHQIIATSTEANLQ